MPSKEPWVGTWRPHKPRGPIAALYGSPGPKYALPGLTGGNNHDPTEPKAPAFSFGTRYKEVKMSCSPGPKYKIPYNVIGDGQDGAPAFSIHSRPKELKLFKTPGPGHYSPENSGKAVFRSTPSFSLYGRTREGKTWQTPGPANYTLPPMLGPKTAATYSAPAYSLYGRSKTGSFHEDLKKTPGPAAYKAVDPSIYREKTPQHSMTGRNFAPGETTKKPGPGAHYPERVTLAKAKPPSYSFGLRHSQYVLPIIINADE